MSRVCTIEYPDYMPHGYVPKDVEDQEKLWEEYDAEKEQYEEEQRKAKEKHLKKNEHRPDSFKVTFTLDGKRVLASCKRGSFVHTGMARCHPHDSFDLVTGMELAFKRMLHGSQLYKGEKFYYLDESFNIKEGTWHGSQREKTMFNNGNIFIFKRYAEQAKEELKKFFENKIKTDFTNGGMQSAERKSYSD